MISVKINALYLISIYNSSWEVAYECCWKRRNIIVNMLSSYALYLVHYWLLSENLPLRNPVLSFCWAKIQLHSIHSAVWIVTFCWLGLTILSEGELARAHWIPENCVAQTSIMICTLSWFRITFWRLVLVLLVLVYVRFQKTGKHWKLVGHWNIRKKDKNTKK